MRPGNITTITVGVNCVILVSTHFSPFCSLRMDSLNIECYDQGRHSDTDLGPSIAASKWGLLLFRIFNGAALLGQVFQVIILMLIVLFDIAD